MNANSNTNNANANESQHETKNATDHGETKIETFRFRNLQYNLPVATVVMLSCALMLMFCLHSNTENKVNLRATILVFHYHDIRIFQLFRESRADDIVKSRQLGNVAQKEIGKLNDFNMFCSTSQ